MCLSHFLRSQFSSPSGWFGSLVVAPFLNVTNMRSIDTGIELLEPDIDDRVLDVGFGGGYSLMALARRLSQGAVVGVDYSHDMVNIATNLIREKHLNSRVHVCRRDVAKLPFPEESFDKVLTVNTIYYWPSLTVELCEIARVLKSRGRLAVVFRSPWNLRPFTLGWEEFNCTNRMRFSRQCAKQDFVRWGWLTAINGLSRIPSLRLVNAGGDRCSAQGGNGPDRQQRRTLVSFQSAIE